MAEKNKQWLVSSSGKKSDKGEKKSVNRDSNSGKFIKNDRKGQQSQDGGGQTTTSSGGPRKKQ